MAPAVSGKCEYPRPALATRHGLPATWDSLEAEPGDALFFDGLFPEPIERLGLQDDETATNGNIPLVPVPEVAVRAFASMDLGAGVSAL